MAAYAASDSEADSDADDVPHLVADVAGDIYAASSEEELLEPPARRQRRGPYKVPQILLILIHRRTYLD